MNNAGYGQFGMVEELSEAEARAQIETNLFGALWVTQAALPFLREQGSGHILQVSSIGGISAFPNIGMYHASKWALEGISQALAAEVADFGIKVTLIEPTGYSTDWGGSVGQARRPAPRLRAGAREGREGRERAAEHPRRPGGDPRRGAQDRRRREPAAADLLRRRAARRSRQADYESRIKVWDEWEPVSIEAQG